MSEPRPGSERHPLSRARPAPASHTAVMRYDASSREFRLAASTGMSPEARDAAERGLVFTFGEERGLVGLVGARRQSLYVANTLSEPRWVPYLPQLRSAYLTPLVAGDELLGVFILLSEAVDAFSTHERALADMYADELAGRWRLAAWVDALPDGRTLADAPASLPSSLVIELKGLTQSATHPAAPATPRAQHIPALSDLSERELEVIGALRRGLRSSQIARSLSISPHTARNHLKRVYRKLGVHSQVELLSLLESGSSAQPINTAQTAGLRVLFVESDPRAAELMHVALEQHTTPVTLTVARDLAEARAALTASAPPYDVVLTLTSLPDGSGLDLIASLRARSLPVPVIALTENTASDQAVSALKAGADDYLLKTDDYLARVPSALQAALDRFRAEAARAKQPLRILYAEDNVADADLATRHLQRHAPHMRLDVVRTGEEVLERLPRSADAEPPYDVVLLDYRLPTSDAFDLLKILRDERKLDLAVVVVTGYSDGQVAAQAFRFGATEYLIKHPGYLYALPALLQGACHRVALAREQRALRKQEQALRDSEARFRVLFEHIGVGVAQVDVANGRTVATNQKYCELFGYRHDELIGSPFADLLHPDDAALHCTNLAGLIASDVREFSADHRGRRKDGRLVWLNITLSLTHSAHQPRAHYIVVIRDITDQKLMQEAQRVLSTEVGNLTGADFFDEIASQTATLLGVEIGFVAKRIPSNPPRVRMLGSAVAGERSGGLEYPLAGTPCERVLARQSGFFPRDVTALFPSAAWLRTLNVTGYMAVPLLNSAQQPVGLLGVMSREPLEEPDRLEMLLQLFGARAAAELERQRTDAQFHDLFEFLPDAVIIVNGAGGIVLANRQAETLFGYTQQELVGMPVERLMPERGRAEHALLRQRFLSSEVPRPMGLGRRQLRAQRKDGAEFSVDICLSPMRSDSGAWVVAAVRDVSERERIELERADLETHLRRTQKLDALGRLASGIAHDLNNLLTVIMGCTDALQMDLDPQHPAQLDIGQLQLAAARSSDLLSRLLTFGRQGPTSLRPLRVGPVVAEAVALVRFTLPKTLTLSSVIHSTRAIQGDPTQIIQAILNLLTNACDALEGRPGQVEIGVDDLVFDAPTMHAGTAIPAGDYVHVQVRDNGAGLDASARDRLFEPFFSTKPVGEGTGLGLSVVHGVMRNHNGLISFASEHAVGTTFHLYFPALPHGRAHSERAADPTEPGAPH